MQRISEKDLAPRTTSAAPTGQPPPAASAETACATLDLLLELVEERAAIREYDAGLPRAEAEAAALAEVTVVAGPLAQSLHAAWEEARLSGTSD